jgi:hypothetical protein
VDPLNLKYQQSVSFSGTSIAEFGNVEKNSLLEVDCSDFCIAHLRPDFVDDIYFPSSEDEYYDGGDDLWDWGNHILDCI